MITINVSLSYADLLSADMDKAIENLQKLGAVANVQVSTPPVTSAPATASSAPAKTEKKEKAAPAATATEAPVVAMTQPANEEKQEVKYTAEDVRKKSTDLVSAYGLPMRLKIAAVFEEMDVPRNDEGNRTLKMLKTEQYEEFMNRLSELEKTA